MGEGTPFCEGCRDLGTCIYCRKNTTEPELLECKNKSTFCLSDSTAGNVACSYTQTRAHDMCAGAFAVALFVAAQDQEKSLNEDCAATIKSAKVN